MDYLRRSSSSSSSPSSSSSLIKMNSLLTTFTSIIVISSLLLLTSSPSSLVEAKNLRDRKPNPRSCFEAQLCCQGQNNTCFVFGDRMDLNSNSKKCYCDSNCIIMGDCCTDYHHTCKSVDCQVSDWTDWTHCDNPCGYGTRRRTRGVATYPDNGGSLCPILKQRRACVGYEKEVCQQNLIGEQTEELSERARILPIKFGTFRNLKKYDPWKGILKNLYNKYFNEIFTRATYRGVFKITKAHYGCKDSDWAKYLEDDATICVECQPVAMNREIGMRCLGHGVFGAETDWSAVDVPHCHGKWTMEHKHESRACDFSVDYENNRNFIFV